MHLKTFSPKDLMTPASTEMQNDAAELAERHGLSEFIISGDGGSIADFGEDGFSEVQVKAFHDDLEELKARHRKA